MTERKYTPAELIDFLEKVGNHPDFEGDQKTCFYLAKIVGNHVQLLNDVKEARKQLDQKRTLKMPVPRTVDVLGAAT